VALLVLLIPISKAKADVLGNWTYSQSCSNSGSVEVIGDAIILHGPDMGGCSGAAHWVKIESVIPEGVNTVDFTWTFQTNDGAWYDPPQYAVNGNFVQLTMANYATGSLSIPVIEGDVFTFRQYSVDTCCQPGNLTISNLSLWTAAPTTSSTTTPTTLETTSTTTTTTSTTLAPTTTEAEPQTTTSAPQIPSSTSSSSSSQPQTTTTLEEITTTSVIPVTIPTIPFTPPTTVFVPTGTTTTIVEEPIEMPIPLEDLPLTTEMPVGIDPPLELPTTIEDVPLVQDNNLIDQVLPEIGPQLEDLLPSEPITDAVLDAIIADSFTPDASAEQVSAAIDSILTSDVTFAQLESVVDAVFTEDATVEVMSAALESLVDADLSVRELATVLDAVFDSDLSDEATIELATELLSQPLSTEEFNTVLNAIFDEQISDEVLVETFNAVLDTPLTQERFAEVVNVLDSDAITNDQVAQVVDLVIGQDGGVPPEQAVELVSSAKVLESVSGDQATEVFSAVDEGALTAENGAQITQAVQAAPKAVRNAFQEEINVFGGVFDGYYPLGSMVDVGTRRVVVAGTGVLLSAPILVSRRGRV
jgi:hypothetical protein